MVYLIHFNKKFKHAKHYIGFCKDGRLKERMFHHKNGTGSKLMKAVSKAKINWKVVRVWDNEDGNFERKLKNMKNSKKLCPICNKNIK